MGDGNPADPIIHTVHDPTTLVTDLKDVGRYEFKLLIYNFRDLLSDEDHVFVWVYEGMSLPTIRWRPYVCVGVWRYVITYYQMKTICLCGCMKVCHYLLSDEDHMCVWVYECMPLPTIRWRPYVCVGVWRYAIADEDHLFRCMKVCHCRWRPSVCACVWRYATCFSGCMKVCHSRLSSHVCLGVWRYLIAYC